MNALGEEYLRWREGIMQSRQLGLTDTYNRFHDSEHSSTDIQKLRDLHVEMDKAVAAAYGWTDLKLDHDFHETKQGIRFTISEAARRAALQRLLKLNHERHEEETAEGLRKKKGQTKPVPKKKAVERTTSKHEATLFDMGEEEDS